MQNCNNYELFKLIKKDKHKSKINESLIIPLTNKCFSTKFFYIKLKNKLKACNYLFNMYDDYDYESKNNHIKKYRIYRPIFINLSYKEILYLLKIFKYEYNSLGFELYDIILTTLIKNRHMLTTAEFIEVFCYDNLITYYMKGEDMSGYNTCLLQLYDKHVLSLTYDQQITTLLSIYMSTYNAQYLNDYMDKLTSIININDNSTDISITTNLLNYYIAIIEMPLNKEHMHLLNYIKNNINVSIIDKYDNKPIEFLLLYNITLTDNQIDILTTYKYDDNNKYFIYFCLTYLHADNPIRIDAIKQIVDKYKRPLYRFENNEYMIKDIATYRCNDILNFVSVYGIYLDYVNIDNPKDVIIHMNNNKYARRLNIIKKNCLEKLGFTVTLL